MAQDVNLQQEIFQKTLEAVLQDGDHGEVNPCVICLEQIKDVGIALPCKHASFDFICLASWLGERAACPLCQGNVTGVKYDVNSPQGPKIYSVSASESSVIADVPLTHSQRGLSLRGRFQGGTSSRRPRRQQRQQPSVVDPVARRRQIYREELYSQRVGTNRLSQYREITPQSFNQDETLVSRARKWIRRELHVFEFLNPDNTGDGSNLSHGSTRRRAHNAEFLLEYIIAILRTVDIKGSGGQAEDLLQEFIGRPNARLFLHELHAWLRSPYNSLEDWDRAVQYDERRERFPDEQAHANDVSSNRRDSRRAQPIAGSYRTRGIRKGRTGQRQLNISHSRRIQNARRRYRPD